MNKVEREMGVIYEEVRKLDNFVYLHTVNADELLEKNQIPDQIKIIENQLNYLENLYKIETYGS